MISDTYGPGVQRPKVLNIAKNYRTGEWVAFSAENIPYDVVYIDDVVSAFLLIGGRLLFGEFRNEIF